MPAHPFALAGGIPFCVMLGHLVE